MTEIIVALIAGGCGIIGALITSKVMSDKVQQQLVVGQAITETELKELTREVREHNGFAKRVPALEEQMKAVIARLKKLEKFHEPRG